MSNPHNHPVDIVITWVDGHDPRHQSKLTSYLHAQGIKTHEGAAPTRFNECGEIDFCLKSIVKFAPWVDTIYIVTDAQTPPNLLSYEKKIVLVDHQDIFRGYEQYLPTFNSLSIETLLWRIEGLSEKFIYMNDDCSFIKSVTYHDFFCEDKLILRGQWKTQLQQKFFNRLKSMLYQVVGQNYDAFKQNLHRRLQENTARMLGFEKQFFHLPHLPAPLFKSIFEDFFEKQPALLLQNISYALRDPQQFWPISLAHHLAIRSNKAIIDNRLKELTINPAHHHLGKIKAKLNSATLNEANPFFCMQSMDAASEDCERFVLSWLHDILS